MSRKIAEKLASELATFMLIVEAGIKADLIMASSFKVLILDKPTLPLKRILFIYFSLRFRKNWAKIEA